jgi:hypothetical protein
MKTPFYRDNNVHAVKRLIDEQTQIVIEEGTVVGISKNEARIQLKGSGKLQPAFVGKGIQIEQNDRVLLVRSPRTGSWVILGSYVNPQGAGNISSDSTTSALAPSGLTAIPILGGFIMRCAAGVDAPVVTEFEVADDTAETGAVNLLIAGSVLPYAITTAKQVRARSVDAKWNKSGWTGWITATPMTKISLALGGTNADLSATGAGYLKQATTGANVSVSAIAQADLPVFTGDSGSGGVKGAVPAPASGDAAGLKFLMADATWKTPSVSSFDVTGTRGESLSARDIVYLNESDNQWYKIDANATGPIKVGRKKGIVVSSSAGTNNTTIRLIGVLSGWSGLTAGLPIYAATTAGGYTQTKPAVSTGGGQLVIVQIGTAISTTEVFISPSPLVFASQDTLANNGTLTISHINDDATSTRRVRAFSVGIVIYSSDLATTGQVIHGGIEASGQEADKAFDNDSSTFASINSGSSVYIGQDFGTDKAIRRVTVNKGAGSFTFDAKLQYSDNGSAWTDAGLTVNPGSAGVNSYDVPDNGAHRYWRWLDLQDDAYLQCVELEMMDIVTDNVHGPVVCGLFNGGTRDVAIDLVDETTTTFKNVYGSSLVLLCEAEIL